jgi:hypothetical protein
MKSIVALFGQTDRGLFHTPYLCRSLTDLLTTFGNPPKDTQGLDFAIQAIMNEEDVIFFRVSEEGFSQNDYLKSFEILKDPKRIKRVDAICMPKVGDRLLIDATIPICELHRSLLILSEKDLYDYLTN